MSYEPTLIIVKADLQEKAQEIEAFLNKTRPKKITDQWQKNRNAYYALKDCLLYEGIKIAGTVIIIVHPEGTEHNRDVRALLHGLNIEFAVHN